MKIWLKIVLVATTITTSVIAGTPAWSTSVSTVKWIDANNYVASTLYQKKFTLTSTIEGGCGSTTNPIVLRTEFTDLGRFQMRSFEASLLTALSAGMSIRILRDGDLCYANSILVCADAACIAPTYTN